MDRPLVFPLNHNHLRADRHRPDPLYHIPLWMGKWYYVQGTEDAALFGERVFSNGREFRGGKLVAILNEDDPNKRLVRLRCGHEPTDKEFEVPACLLLPVMR